MTATQPAKILVVFYSRTGRTREIATAIARYCGADVEELRDVAGRGGIFGYLRSAREAMRKVPGAIRELQKDARNYDVVLLGTPIWAGHTASPLRAFLARQSAPLKRVAFFSTMGGRGAENVFAELAQLTGQKPFATLAMTDSEIAERRYDARLGDFAGKLLHPDAAPTEVLMEHTRLASIH